EGVGLCRFSLPLGHGEVVARLRVAEACSHALAVPIPIGLDLLPMALRVRPVALRRGPEFRRMLVGFAPGVLRLGLDRRLVFLGYRNDLAVSLDDLVFQRLEGFEN